MNDSTLSTILMLGLMAVAFWFLLIRPAQKKQKAQLDMVSSLSEGARVMTTAGLFGTIRHLGERQAIIEIAPGVELTLLKQAILRVVPGSEEEFEYDEEDGLDEDGLDETEVEDGLDEAGVEVVDPGGEASSTTAIEEPHAGDPQRGATGFERPDKPHNTSL